MKSPWPLKPLLVIITFVVGIAAPELIPQWYNWRIFEWATASAVFDFQPRSRASEPLLEEMERLRPNTAHIMPDAAKIQDPSKAMEHFYAALFRTDQKVPGAVTRILHYGDSPTTADLITADTRFMLQERFGDAGHGTYLIAKPWAWYAHRGIEVTSSGWTIDPATLHGQRDGRYGLGGVSFTGDAGSESSFSIRRPGHTKLRLSYLGFPGGGSLRILAGKIVIADLDTASTVAKDLEQTWPIPPEAQKFQILVTSGTVRLFDVEFLKDPPGVIYDSIGLNGTWAGVLAAHMNGPHWIDQLEMAKPDLVIINYGTNESGYKNYINTSYPKDVKEILRRVRAAVPETSILLMSPMDRGVREAGGNIGTVPTLPQLVSLQAKLAAENRCAFFNTFEAMGGPGTMGKWYMAEPRLVSADFIHPMPAGARIVGTLLYQALSDGYNRYKLKRYRQPVAEARKQ